MPSVILYQFLKILLFFQPRQHDASMRLQVGKIVDRTYNLRTSLTGDVAHSPIHGITCIPHQVLIENAASKFNIHLDYLSSQFIRPLTTAHSRQR